MALIIQVALGIVLGVWLTVLSQRMVKNPTFRHVAKAIGNGLGITFGLVLTAGLLYGGWWLLDWGVRSSGLSWGKALAGIGPVAAFVLGGQIRAAMRSQNPPRHG